MEHKPSESASYKMKRSINKTPWTTGNGILAAHRALVDGVWKPQHGYTITHVRSGVVLSRCRTFDEAKWVASMLVSFCNLEAFETFDDYQSYPLDLRLEVLMLIRSLKDAAMYPAYGRRAEFSAIRLPIAAMASTKDENPSGS
jgi:hypothetical protein